MYSFRSNYHPSTTSARSQAGHCRCQPVDPADRYQPVGIYAPGNLKNDDNRKHRNDDRREQGIAPTTSPDHPSVRRGPRRMRAPNIAHAKERDRDQHRAQDCDASFKGGRKNRVTPQRPAGGLIGPSWRGTRSAGRHRSAPRAQRPTRPSRAEQDPTAPETPSRTSAETPGEPSAFMITTTHFPLSIVQSRGLFTAATHRRHPETLGPRSTRIGSALVPGVHHILDVVFEEVPSR